MLTQNMIWNTPVVQLGLMNGARGTIVAILYAKEGELRTDGNAMAGVGMPSPGSMPLPDFVVVNFPEYTGPSLFCDLPRTWVPIPPSQVANKENKQYCRCGLSLVCSWAMTIHKAQGLSSSEGCIVSMETLNPNSSPVASTPGLAFVGWTRATKWSRMAFCELPPLGDFVSVRQHEGFRLRTGASRSGGHGHLHGHTAPRRPSSVRPKHTHAGRGQLGAWRTASSGHAPPPRTWPSASAARRPPCACGGGCRPAPEAAC